MQVVDQVAGTDGKPVDALLEVALPVPVPCLRALSDQAVELEQERKHLVGAEAVTVAGGVVHRACGHEGPHTGLKGHDGAELDFVLPHSENVHPSADEPLPPPKHDGRQLPPRLPGHGFCKVDVLRDEAGRELPDGNALPHVPDAAKGKAATFAFLPAPDHGVPGPDRRVERLVAVGGAERAAALLNLRTHEVADRCAESGLLEIRALRLHEAAIDLHEAGDREVACAALLADQLMQQLRVLRVGPDLSCALDHNASHGGRCRRKR